MTGKGSSSGAPGQGGENTAGGVLAGMKRSMAEQSLSAKNQAEDLAVLMRRLEEMRLEVDRHLHRLSR